MACFVMTDNSLFVNRKIVVRLVKEVFCDTFNISDYNIIKLDIFIHSINLKI